MGKILSNSRILAGFCVISVFVLALACTTEKIVEVPGETIVKEVQIPGETIIQTETVIKEVAVPGETVVVETEVVRMVEVPGQTVEVVREVVKTVEVPGEAVIVIATPAPALPTPVPGNLINVFGVTLPADAAPVADQYLRRMYTREGEALDFAASVYNSAGGGFQSSMSLAMLDTNLGTSPGAALSWESSADLKTWTFHIDPDLTWSDGVPVTSDDYVWTWRYYADPEHAYDFSWYFGSLDVVNYADVHSGALPLDALGVKAVDSKTLEFNLMYPAPYTPGFMMYGTPLAKHQAEQYGPYYGNTPATSVSMNPWILTDYTPLQHSVFEPNMNYTGRFWPYVERIKNVYGERDFDAYLAGEIDTVNGPFSPSDQAYMMRNADLMAERGLSPGDFRTHYMFFDFDSAPFNDVKVRQAFAKAIDRPAIMENIVGVEAGRPSYGILIPGFPDAVSPEDLKQYQGLDVAAAQQLMTDAGFSGGAGFPDLSLKLRSEDQLVQDIAAAVGSQIKTNLGVNVTINNMTRKDYMAELNGHNMEFGMVSYGFDYVDASNFLSVFKTQGRHNWDNAEFETLRVEAAGNADPVERAAQMSKLQHILSEDVGSLFLWNQVQNQLHKPYLAGNWRLKNQAGWQGLQYPDWNPGFGVQNIYTLYVSDRVANSTRSPF